MIIAVCSDNYSFQSKKTDFNGEIYNFRISRDALSETDILDSAFSTPARYVLEMFLRLTSKTLSIYSNLQPILIFNPLYEYLSLEISMTLYEINKTSTKELDSLILSDKNNIPIAYFFINPTKIKKNQNHLRLLSTVDASIDRTFIEKSYACHTSIKTIDKIRLNIKYNHNRFYYDKQYKTIYRLPTIHAIKVLSTQNIEHLKPAIIMPFHAGDILFLAIAEKSSLSYFSHVVIWEKYKYIIKESKTKLKPLLVSLDPPFRESSKISSDIDYILALYIEQLDQNFLYYYGRPTRSYKDTDHHLIDHFAFAIGNQCKTEKELISKKKATLNKRSVCTTPKKSIFLHFDGGWALKVYPKHWQEQLVRLLLDYGFDVTILCDKKDLNDDSLCKRTTFENLSSLKQLLLSHHIVVGMDSFPAHFATHILGIPTICLFSNTKPCNSDSQISAYYTYLHTQKCPPCYSMDRCPKKLEFCENFLPPNEVFYEIRDMYSYLYEHKHPDAPRKAVFRQTKSQHIKKTVFIKDNITEYESFFYLLIYITIKPIMEIKYYIEALQRWITTKGIKVAARQVLTVLQRDILKI